MTHRETIPKNQAGIGQNDTHEFASSSTESHVPTTVRTTALSDHDASLTRCSQEQEQRSNTCDYVTLPAKIACVRCQKKVNTDVCMSGYLNNEPTERCIFCHDTDGTQYVAVHANSESYKCIPYSESLKGHRACANCWAAWEAKVIKQSGSFTRSGLQVVLHLALTQSVYHAQFVNDQLMFDKDILTTCFAVVAWTLSCASHGHHRRQSHPRVHVLVAVVAIFLLRWLSVELPLSYVK